MLKFTISQRERLKYEIYYPDLRRQNNFITAYWTLPAVACCKKRLQMPQKKKQIHHKEIQSHYRDTETHQRDLKQPKEMRITAKNK